MKYIQACFADVVDARNLNPEGKRLVEEEYRFSYRSFLFKREPSIKRLALQCALNFCIVENGVPDKLCPVQSSARPSCDWTRSHIDYNHGHSLFDP